jgi:transcriptional regulatory protein LEU3
VASRRYREDITLMHALSDRVMKHIWAEIPNPPYKVSTFQALVILCIWPFPTTTTNKSVSVTLSSIAIGASMQLGLYMPFDT